MTLDDKQFMIDNIDNFHTAKYGYIKNLSKSKLDTYEKIYRKYIYNGFVLNQWCSNCVLAMIKELSKYWDKVNI